MIKIPYLFSVDRLFPYFLATVFAMPIHTGYNQASLTGTGKVQTPPTVAVLSLKDLGKIPDHGTFPDFTQQYQNTIVIPAQQAAQAAADAQAAQDAANAAQAAQSAPQPPVAPPVVSYGGSCGSWMAAAGITDIADATYLINKESGCNPNAVNRSSGACGIGQQLPCGKWPHAWNDPIGGLIDMQSYVFASYGSWANAAAHERAYRNY